MTQQHVRWEPIGSCTCQLDIILDTDTGNQTLFAIRRLCDNHKPIAVPDPDFANKKAQLRADRTAAFEANRSRNYAQIDSYTDLEMSPADKAACKAQVDKHTQDGINEYEQLLSQPESNLYLCTNVHTSVLEEAGRYPKIYNQIKSQFGFTDDQMKQITYGYTGKAPNRIITVNFGTLLTTAQKNSTKTWCDTNIGAGRVVIV